jgi:hypothetical protein
MKFTPIRLLSLIGVVLGVLIVAVTLPGVIGGVFSAQQSTGGENASTDADLRVTTVAATPGRATLTVRLDGEVDGDLEAVLSLPNGVTVAQAPDGWSCELDGPVVTCRLDTTRQGTFELLDTRADQVGQYRLDLTGESRGRSVAGFAEGTITEEEQAVSASVG